MDASAPLADINRLEFIALLGELNAIYSASYPISPNAKEESSLLVWMIGSIVGQPNCLTSQELTLLLCDLAVIMVCRYVPASKAQPVKSAIETVRQWTYGMATLDDVNAVAETVAYICIFADLGDAAVESVAAVLALAQYAGTVGSGFSVAHCAAAAACVASAAAAVNAADVHAYFLKRLAIMWKVGVAAPRTRKED